MNTPSPTESPPVPLTPTEEAQIASDLGKPAEVVKWGPLSPVALLALDYVVQAEKAANARIHAYLAKERADAEARWDGFVSAVVGRAQPLEGHGVDTRTIDGKTYLVAVPSDPKGQS